MPNLTSGTRPRILQNLKRPRQIRLDTLEAATQLPGKATQLLVGIWLMAVLFKSPTVPLTRRTMARVNVSRYAATDALRRLEGAGLVKVWRLKGRSPRVTLVEQGTGTPLRLETPD
jgi:DNA-binding transcriptional ArsR family regulator